MPTERCAICDSRRIVLRNVAPWGCLCVDCVLEVFPDFAAVAIAARRLSNAIKLRGTVAIYCDGCDHDADIQLQALLDALVLAAADEEG
jgi:hypothetical protein